MSARGHFVLYVALLLLPLLAFAAWLAAQYVRSERSRLEQSVQATTQQIAGDVDRDLAELLAALYTLSTSRSITEEDFAALHRQMSDARAYVGADILLRSADGRKLVDTRVAWGESLGSLRLPRDVDVLEIKAPVISGVFADSESRETRYSIILPILRDDKVAYLLSYNIPTTRLLPFLRRDQPDFVASSITDRNGNFVARSGRHEELSGTPGNAGLIAGAQGRQGVWSGTNQDGIEVVIGYYRSPLSGWLIASSISQAALQTPLNASLKAFFGFGLVALTLSIALALWFGQKVAVPLADLARGAAALGRGEDVSMPHDGVREIDAVSRALEQAARMLRDREEELRRVQQIGRVGGFEIDLSQGFRKRLSREFLRLYGIQPPKAGYETHDEWLERIHPDDRENAEARFQEALGSDALEYTMEYRVVRAHDGDVRWVSVKGEIERDAQGRALRVIGANTDVSETKRAEAALQTLNESLEAQVEERTAQISQLQKLEAVGQLTGGVAHDFNNLLTVIVGNLEMLRKRLSHEPRLMRLIDNAMQGANRGAALTQRLLAFARRQELRPEAVDVEQLIEGMSELLRRSLGPLIEISTDLPPKLSAALVDANQLELAILNLAVNGRDAMPRGGRLAIAASNETIRAYGLGDLADGEYVVISVSDNGEGMDETTLRRAAEPFFTTKGLGKGTGLGLSMVHGLAAQSGGTLRLISQPGKGTTAQLWLPRAERSAVVKVADVPAPAPATESYRVLVVDDDPLVLAGTTDMLEDLHHVVVSASSARQALEILRAGASVDVVVTDHAMPSMTGTQLAEQIRRGWPTLPVVLATGYAELPEGSETQLLRIAKPFGADTLMQAIETAIQTERDSSVVAFRRS